MWQAQRVALERRGHTVIAPRHVPRPSVDESAADLAQILDKSGISRAVVVGSSMGGYIALAILRGYGQRLLGLGLLSTRASADTATVAAQRLHFAELVLRDPSLIAATTPKLMGATTRQRRPEIVAAVDAIASRCEPATVAACQRAIATRPDSLAALGCADLPAIVLVGEEDELVAVPEAAEAASALQCPLDVVPTAGHLPSMETPGAVTRRLIELVSAC